MGASLKKMDQLGQKEREEKEERVKTEERVERVETEERVERVETEERVERVERQDTTIVKFSMVVASTGKRMKISSKFQLNF
jgi:NAD(P)H-nitrite reductase large subunit